jgi:hypothetical protein
MDTIDRLREEEQINFLRSRKITGFMPTLVQTLCELYDTLGSLIGESQPSVEQVHGTVPFALACRYELVMGTMMAFRGHLSDSYHFTRRAIELCAFAARISRHPHLMREWRQSWQDLSRYDKVWEKFSSKKLFPDDRPELKELYHPYDLCSKLVHSSAFSISGKIKVANVGDGQMYTFRYSELQEADVSEPVRTEIFILRVHLSILRVFESILKTLKVKNPETFSNNLAVFQNRFVAFREEWKDVVAQE